ncbi:MAG: hypothetical protein ABIJ31_12405 [Pseudomonadota bacterium]
MNRREKYSVGIGCALVLVTAVFHFGISPVLDKTALLERQLVAKRLVLQEVTALKNEYKSILSKSENLNAIYSQREKGFTLFAFLEKLAVKAGVDKQIDYMKPSSSVDKVSKIELSSVELKLKGIKLSELMSYLYLVETSKNIVFVKRLAITKDGKDQSTISAVINVETVSS